jgi:NADH:ubiquinone oxidoreductase subunit 6 (subunit J)
MSTDLLVAISFYALAAMAIVGAIGVVAAKRIFHSALFLTAMLGSVAGAYVVLGADFLAAVQILVYVGAIMVLIIFGIMLTPQSVELPDAGGPGQAIAGVVVAVAIFMVSAGVLTAAVWPKLSLTPTDIPTTPAIGIGLLTTFGLPFELASVLLLLAMIGAIVVARED